MDDYIMESENNETDASDSIFSEEYSLLQGNSGSTGSLSHEAIAGADEGDVLSLFAVQLTVYVRSFKGQTSGRSIGVWELHVSTVEELKSTLWNEVKPHLKREIIMENNEFKWHIDPEPVEADLSKFVLFYDKISKRSMELECVNTTILQHWGNRCVYLYVHEYSWFISSKGMFQTVQKSLIQPVERDRAGAAAQVVVIEITKKLKERHKNNFKASNICWYQWANKILSSDAHRREDMINDAPPPELIHLQHNESLLSAMEEAVSPEETAVSQNLEQQIDDQVDVDHS